MESNAENEKQSDINEAMRFIEALVKASQLYGVSTHEMVSSLSRVAKAVGLRGEFLSTPNYVQTVMWGEDEHQQRVHLAVSRSGDYNLAKLVRVRKVAELVQGHSISPTEGLNRLREIVLAPDEYGPLWNALAFACAGVAFAVVIDSSWMTALFGGIISLASFAVTLIAARHTGLAALQEILVTMVAAILAVVAAGIFPGINPIGVTVIACVWFIPGFGLTIAPRELLMGNTLSGIIWLTNAVVAAVKLLAGAALGVAVARGVGFSVASVSPGADIGPAWKWAAVPVLVIALGVLLKVDWHNFWAILLGGWLVWGMVRLGSPIGFWPGTFLGATALVIYATWHGRRFGVPSTVTVLPCIMLLVPGLPALRAFHTAETQGALAGLQAAYNVLILIVAIIGGSLVGSALTLHNVARTGKAMRSLIAASVGLGRGRHEK